MDAQLDIEVTFAYPNISKVNIEEYGHPNEPFDCGNGGPAQRGRYGPFGLLVLTDDAFQEQIAVFFYISGHQSPLGVLFLQRPKQIITSAGS